MVVLTFVIVNKLELKTVRFEEQPFPVQRKFEKSGKEF
jgi:hypothetical protein